MIDLPEEGLSKFIYTKRTFPTKSHAQKKTQKKKYEITLIDIKSKFKELEIF